MKKVIEQFRWIGVYLTSSIGKKQQLAVAGAALTAFLGGHALGNLKLLNPDPVAAQASYNAYCAFLMSLKPFLYAIEGGLAALLLFHAAMALVLKLGNRKARGPQRYAVVARKGEATPGSFTMFLTGSAILVFMIQHLVFFKFGEYYLYRNAAGEIVRDMWLTAADTFANPLWTLVYVAALLVLGLHLMHALPSLFRTFGLAHRKWTPIFNLIAAAIELGLMCSFLAAAVGTCVLANRENAKDLRANAHSLQQALQTELAEEASK